MTIDVIAIPTVGREDKQITLRSLVTLPEWKGKVVLVTTPKREEKLKAFVGTRARVVACPVDGISHTRKWILTDFADAEKARYVLMLDDDMDFCYRPDVAQPKLEMSNGERVDRMLRTLSGWLSDDGFVHVGISARQGNNRPFFNDEKVYGLHPYRDATRMMNAYAYDVRGLRKAKVELGRMEVMEDFDLTLQLLRRGLPNRVSFEYCWNQRGSGAQGGCSTYRTPEMQAEAAHKLASFHPDFVKVVTKASKETSASWKGMKERVDVVVQWRDAYDSSRVPA